MAMLSVNHTNEKKKVHDRKPCHAGSRNWKKVYILILINLRNAATQSDVTNEYPAGQEKLPVLQGLLIDHWTGQWNIHILAGCKSSCFVAFLEVNTCSFVLNTMEFYLKIYTSVWPRGQLGVMRALAGAANELFKQRCVCLMQRN